MSSFDAFSDLVTGFVWLLSFRKNALRFVVIYPASFFSVWVVIRGRKADYFGKFAWENTSYAATGSIARFDASAIRIPVWLMVMWTVGSALVLVWQWFVNFRFEKKLYEEREKLPQDTAAYPVYLVNDIASSCAFKIHGEKSDLCRGRRQPMIWKFFRRLSNMKPVIWILGICFWKSSNAFDSGLLFSPIAWLAAVLSKRDCEMACDERTINRMGIAKRRIRKILLDLTVERLNTDVLFCHAVMISPSSYGLKARIRNVFVKAEKQKKRTDSDGDSGCAVLRWNMFFMKFHFT